MSIAKPKSMSFAGLHDYSIHNNILSPTYGPCFRWSERSEAALDMSSCRAEMRRCGLVDGLPNVQRAHEHSVAGHGRNVMYGSAW
jgi:hypothetical protein